MSNSPSPQTTLDEIKRRMGKAQEVVVDSEGRLHTPEDPEIKEKMHQEKTTVKPQRWF